MKFNSILLSIFKLLKSRAKEIFMWLWVTAVSCLIVSKGFPPLYPFFMAVTSIFFIASSVYVYNDLVDREVDKYHKIKKYRPLPSGEVAPWDAKLVVVIFGILGLVLSYAININCFIFCSVYYLLYVLYSYPPIYLKRIMILKECIVTSGMILTSLVGNYSITNSFSKSAFFASTLFAIFAFTGQPALNDTLDIEQDRMFGVKSLATVLSWRRKMQLFILGILIVMTLTPLTYRSFEFHVIFPIFVVVGGLIILRYMFPIMNAFQQSAMMNAYKISYIYIFLIQIFSIIGSLQL